MEADKRQMLYNKYRPQIFDDVVGQEHINEVLKGLITTGNFKMLNSLVFVAGAGSGKTTSARIFAKAMNCTDIQNGNPCCKCKNCTDFAKGGYADYIEIDGASYNTVDAAKQLVQIANQYPINPSGYRAIMIDEAHRLSNAAWDIFLKLLEEGQNKTIFLFATTEPDKIRPAIKSRSFVFGLKPLTSKQIERLLIKVCKLEEITYDKQSIKLIAHYNKGKTRDALKTLDTFYMSKGSITEVSLEVPETGILDALVFAVLGKIDEAYSKLDLLAGQELDVRDSVSKVLIDIWRFPNSSESGVSEEDLEKAHTLFQPIIKAVVSEFMSYALDNMEAFKLFLLLVAEKAVGVTKTTTESTNLRKFREVKKDKAIPEEAEKPLADSRVSKMEALLSKAGFEVVD